MDKIVCIEKMVRLEGLLKKTHDPQVKGAIRDEYRKLSKVLRDLTEGEPCDA